MTIHEKERWWVVTGTWIGAVAAVGIVLKCLKDWRVR
jgi:cytochrome c-type biogenesis protein CcmE